MKLLPLEPGDVARILKRLGFSIERQRGSHQVWRHADGRRTTLSIHKGRPVPPGTLRAIVRDAGLSVDEFMKHL